MTFREKCRSGRPNCMECIYFDKRLLREIGSSIVGGASAEKKLTKADGTGNAGICRFDPPGPAALGGWITITDGTMTYCGKWDDGGEPK